jgi:predicted small integral membrane protein
MRITTGKKNVISRWQGISQLMRLYFFAAICVAIVVPPLLSEFGYQPQQTLMAVLLFEICLYPTARYFAHKESGLPAIPILCLAYALQFAVPFFTRDAGIELANAQVKNLSDSDVIAALLMAIVGVCSLQVGYYWFRKSQFKKVAPVAELHLNKSKAVLYCILVGIFVPLLFTFKGIIPEEYQQPLSAILRLLENQVLVVIGVVGWIVYGRKDSKWYAIWLYLLVALTAARGISTGMLEAALVPIGVLFLVKWLYTRRMAIVPVLGAIVMVLFLSPVKSDYREKVWYGAAPETAEMSAPERTLFWIGQATEYWSDTLAGSRDLTEATSSATGRADFIHQVAHIHSMTPSVVPYQYGETYSYFAVAMIPRIIWPDKPQAGNANGFFAVTYGITTEEGAKTTAFGVSLLGEAFINFGWYGVVFIMLLQGIIISVLEHIFGGSRSGPGGQAVFIAFFVFFLNGIGSSAEILFGNILQNLLCGYFLLLWARQKRLQARAPELPFGQPVLSSKLISRL